MRYDYLRNKMREVDKDPYNSIAVYDPEKIEQRENLKMADYYLFRGRAMLVTEAPEEAIQLFTSAHAIYQKLEEKIGLFYTLVYAGVAYRDVRKFEKSGEYIQKAFVLSKEINNNSLLLMSVMHFIILYSDAGLFEEGTKAYEESKDLLKDLDDDGFVADFYHSYGYFLIVKGDYEEARKCLEKAFYYFKRYYNDQMAVNYLIAMANYGGVCCHLEDYETGIKMYCDVLKYADQLSSDRIKVLVLEDLSDAYRKSGKYKEAYDSLVEFIRLKENIHLDQPEEQKEGVDIEKLRDDLEMHRGLVKIKDAERREEENKKKMIAHHLHFINKAVELMEKDLTVKELLEAFSTMIFKWRRFDSLSMGLCNHEKRKIQMLYLYSLGVSRYKPKITIGYENQNSVMAYSWRANEDFVIHDIYEEYKKYVADPIVIDERTMEEVMADKFKYINRSTLVCRMVIDDKIVGIFSLQHPKPYEYHVSDLEVMKPLVTLIGLKLSNCLNKETIRTMDTYDPLTKLYSRATFVEQASALIEEKTAFGLILVEMNHWRVVHANLGAVVRDQYLVEVAKVVKEVFEDHQWFRMGPHRYAVIVPGVKKEKVLLLMEKAKSLCKNKKIGQYSLSVSMGVDFFTGNQTLEDLLKNAETKMYLDKIEYYRDNHITMIKEDFE